MNDSFGYNDYEIFLAIVHIHSYMMDKTIEELIMLLILSIILN